MKQITKTDAIKAKLEAQGVNPDGVTVFEATALNTLPIRKKHPLYKDGVHNKDFLQQMADQLAGESLPLQVMHDTGDTPKGRVFAGEVLDGFSGAELRVLFFVDNSETDLIQKIDNGTIDQVSVSVLPKQVLCSSCNFDFFGEKATIDNIFSGTCDNGHTLGEDGVHAVMNGLDSWFEMSLVGRGGATGARIQSRDQSAFTSDSSKRLAATGIDPNAMILNATSEKVIMDLTKLISDLSDVKAEKITLDGKVASLTADLTAANTTVETLTAEVAELKGQLEADTSKADLDAATTSMAEIAKKLMVASGDVAADVEGKSISELAAIISEKSEALSALAIAAGGKAKGAVDDATKTDAAKFTGISPFRRSR